MNHPDASPPPGFHPYYRDDLFYGAVGPMFVRYMGGKLSFGFRVLEKNANATLICHGGMLMTLADMQIGLATCVEEDVAALVPTVNLNCDFLAPARIGDWVEAASRLVRRTRRMMFVETLLTVGGEPVLRANGIVKIPSTLGWDEFDQIVPPEYIPPEAS